jgi:hypothetical protein
MRTTTKLWIGLGLLGLLTPIGILLPNYTQAGDAWGEWGIKTVQKSVGYIPQGLKTLSGLWPAPFPDYALPGGAQKSFAVQGVEYVFAAAIGIAAVVLTVMLLGKLLARGGHELKDQA